MGMSDAILRTGSGSEGSSPKESLTGAHIHTVHFSLTLRHLPEGFLLDRIDMNIINFLVELLRDPRVAIEGWIAAGPLAAYGFIFLIIFIETGVVVMPFLPGDSLLFAAGFFAHTQALDLVHLLIIVWIAAILGDQCNYIIGRFFGKRVIESGKVKAMTPERIEKSEEFLEKWGTLAIFLGRFFPFIRTFVPFLAGMGKMCWRKFFIFNILGGITWSSVFVLLGYFFGGIKAVQDNFGLVVIGIILVSAIPAVVGVIKTRMNKKNA